MAGFSSSPAGWQSVKDYVVEPPLAANAKLHIPLFLLRGEFDFISEECMDPWWDCVEASQDATQGQQEESSNHRRPVTTLPNVAHCDRYLASLPKMPTPASLEGL